MDKEKSIKARKLKVLPYIKELTDKFNKAISGEHISFNSAYDFEELTEEDNVLIKKEFFNDLLESEKKSLNKISSLLMDRIVSEKKDIYIPIKNMRVVHKDLYKKFFDDISESEKRTRYETDTLLMNKKVSKKEGIYIPDNNIERVYQDMHKEIRKHIGSTTLTLLDDHSVFGIHKHNDNNQYIVSDEKYLKDGKMQLTVIYRWFDTSLLSKEEIENIHNTLTSIYDRVLKENSFRVDRVYLYYYCNKIKDFTSKVCYEDKVINGAHIDNATPGYSLTYMPFYPEYETYYKDGITYNIKHFICNKWYDMFIKNRNYRDIMYLDEVCDVSELIEIKPRTCLETARKHFNKDKIADKDSIKLILKDLVNSGDIKIRVCKENNTETIKGFSLEIDNESLAFFDIKDKNY